MLGVMGISKGGEGVGEAGVVSSIMQFHLVTGRVMVAYLRVCLCLGWYIGGSVTAFLDYRGRWRYVLLFLLSVPTSSWNE